MACARQQYSDGVAAGEELKVFYYEPQPRDESVPLPDPPADSSKEAFVFPSLAYLIAKKAAHLQRKISKSRLHLDVRSLMQRADESTKRRLLSCAGPGAGGFLLAHPVRPDLQMGPAVIIDSVLFRLGVKGINVAKIRPTDRCQCGKVHDYNNLVSEIICCPKAGGHTWILLHDIPKLKLAEIARQAGFSTKVESRVGSD